MRAFVTGGTGFVGGALVHALLGRGDEVVALVRDASRAARLGDGGAVLVEGALEDEEAIRRGLEGCDAAFHCAAVYRVGVAAAQRPAMFETNVAGTERVLDAATAAGCRRIVYVSTVNVFGNTRGRVVDEDHRRDVAAGYLSAYDESKHLAHVAAETRATQGAPVLIAMPGAVYGPGDTSQLGDQVDRARRGRLPFISFPDLGLVMCHVDDIAAGLLQVHDRGALGRSYILGGEITTMRQAVRCAAREAGRRPPPLSVPSLMIRATVPLAPVVTRLMRQPPNMSEMVRASDGVTYWASDARARRELGYSPRGLAAGMRELAVPFG